MAEPQPKGAQVDVATSWEAAVPILAVSGELDMSNVDVLKAAVAALRADKVVFDLSALRFMDSAGIAALLEAREQIGSVLLRAPSPTVRRVIEVTGLADVLPVEP
jgi:anti-sigma B factor antagonist